MILKHNIHDIVTYNVQGVMDVGIIVKIVVTETGDIFYNIRGQDLREDQITWYLGHAETVKDQIEKKEKEGDA